MRKPDFCKYENKDADQLCGNRAADQRLCFRYIDSTTPLRPKSETAKPLATFCCHTAMLVSDLVEKPLSQVFSGHGSFRKTMVFSLPVTFHIELERIQLTL